MSVLNELIKEIKFFAWEDKWIAKAMEARDGAQVAAQT